MGTKREMTTERAWERIGEASERTALLRGIIVRGPGARMLPYADPERIREMASLPYAELPEPIREELHRQRTKDGFPEACYIRSREPDP